MITSTFAVLAAVSIAATLMEPPTPPSDTAPAQTKVVEAKVVEPKVVEPKVVEEEGFGAVRTPTLTERVGGDKSATTEVVKGVYRSGPCSIESPLPDGYPEPTPPTAIDIKQYPSVRRAEFQSEPEGGSVRQGMNGGFWPLFNHIKKRDIPMTSPVEMDYAGVFPDITQSVEPKAGGSWTMSFLYRSAKLGPVGEDGSVKIVDVPAVTVVSVGLRGPYGMSVMTKGVKALKTWLDEQATVADGWEIAGTPRCFHYNGPYIADSNKWSEVQIPVKRKVVATPNVEPSTQSAMPASR